MSIFVRAELEKREEYLFPPSLARSANWPRWVHERIGDAYGRNALLRFNQTNQYSCQPTEGHLHNPRCEPRFAYLGTPHDPYNMQADETRILPRSSRNSEQGGYYYHVEPCISLVDDPEAAIMRATINRDAFEWQPEVRTRKWSGWFEQRQRLWLITHLDMITAIDRYRRPRFVAVFDMLELPAGSRVLLDEQCHRINIYANKIKPVFVVPVVGPTDLSPYTIVIKRTGVDRALAAEIYKRACEDLAEARDYYRDTAPLVPLNRDECWPIPLR